VRQIVIDYIYDLEILYQANDLRESCQDLDQSVIHDNEIKVYHSMSVVDANLVYYFVGLHVSEHYLIRIIPYQEHVILNMHDFDNESVFIAFVNFLESHAS